MKHRYSVLVCLVTFFVMFGMLSVAGAQNLSLEATSDGTTSETAFSRGDNLYLNIVVDNAAGVAGCAFTVNYPPEAVSYTHLTLPTTPYV